MNICQELFYVWVKFMKTLENYIFFLHFMIKSILKTNENLLKLLENSIKLLKLKTLQKRYKTNEPFPLPFLSEK